MANHNAPSGGYSKHPQYSVPLNEQPTIISGGGEGMAGGGGAGGGGEADGMPFPFRWRPDDTAIQVLSAAIRSGLEFTITDMKNVGVPELLHLLKAANYKCILNAPGGEVVFSPCQGLKGPR